MATAFAGTVQAMGKAGAAMSIDIAGRQARGLHNGPHLRLFNCHL